MKNVIIIFLIVLSMPRSYASEELNSFCFTSTGERNNARKEIEFLIIKTDKISLKPNCIDILTSSRRSNLFLKYIERKFPQVLITSSITLKKTCHIKVTEITKKNKEKLKAGIQNRSLHARQKNSKFETAKKSSIKILEDTQSQITYQNQMLGLKCLIRGKTYIIELSSNSDSLSVNTSRTLSKGQKIEIGSIIEDSKKDDNDKSLKSIEFNQRKSNHTTLMYLEIE